MVHNIDTTTAMPCSEATIEVSISLPGQRLQRLIVAAMVLTMVLAFPLVVMVSFLLPGPLLLFFFYVRFKTALLEEESNLSPAAAAAKQLWKDLRSKKPMAAQVR